MSEEEQSARKKMVGAWTGAASGIIFWLIVGIIFRWYGVWWWYFLILITLSTPINATIKYNTTETKKCPICSTRVELDAEFCMKCGNKIYASCPKCNSLIRGNARFCQKCGQDLYENIETIPSDSGSNASNMTTQPATLKNVFCPYCGSVIDKESVKCESCGSNLPSKS